MTPAVAYDSASHCLCRIITRTCFLHCSCPSVANKCRHSEYIMPFPVKKQCFFRKTSRFFLTVLVHFSQYHVTVLKFQEASTLPPGTSSPLRSPVPSPLFPVLRPSDACSLFDAVKHDLSHNSMCIAERHPVVHQIVGGIRRVGKASVR